VLANQNLVAVYAELAYLDSASGWAISIAVSKSVAHRSRSIPRNRRPAIALPMRSD